MVAVMGPSGSGKSTLLTIAGSLEDPTNGEVLVGGAALSGRSRNQRARLRRRSIGYVFQDFNLLAGLTAAENVALPLELDGATAKAARVAGMAALDELGLADRSARFPDELSGGERQRVAIARRAPVVVRLALRDLARYRARSGAALAAVSFAVLIAMVISLLATGRYADPVDYFGPNLPSNQLVVYAPGTGPGSGGREHDRRVAGQPRCPCPGLDRRDPGEGDPPRMAGGSRRGVRRHPGAAAPLRDQSQRDRPHYPAHHLAPGP